MKKRMLVLLLLTITLSACASLDRVENVSYDARFVLIADLEYGNVVYDKKTGVEYWMITSGYNKGNLTLLVDEDGNPLIYKGE